MELGLIISIFSLFFSLVAIVLSVMINRNLTRGFRKDEKEMMKILKERKKEQAKVG
jgi:hypothetical protein